MRAAAHPDSWTGRPLIDSDGRRLATIEELYRHEQTGRPQWIVVKIGRFGQRRSLVPLEDARRTPEGIVTPHDIGTIADAPKVDLGAHLRDDQLSALYRHYGLPRDAPADDEAGAPSPRDRVIGYLNDSRTRRDGFSD